jgi:hypothetical protein
MQKHILRIMLKRMQLDWSIRSPGSTNRNRGRWDYVIPRRKDLASDSWLLSRV